SLTSRSSSRTTRMPVRTFIALNLAPDLRPALWAAVTPLRTAYGSAVAWVAEPNLHITLRFLGDRDPAFVEALRERLVEHVRNVGAFDIQLSGVGAFPTLDRPRVLWIGLRPNPSVARLYQSVSEACTLLGVPPEPRPFHP